MQLQGHNRHLDFQFKRQVVKIVGSKAKGRMCAYHEVRNVCVSEILACFAFLKHPFWDSPFCLITDEIYYGFGELQQNLDIALNHFIKLCFNIFIDFIFPRHIQSYKLKNNGLSIFVYCKLTKSIWGYPNLAKSFWWIQ